MTDFLEKAKKKNKSDTFSVWIRKHGETLKNTLTPDKAVLSKTKSAPTHGTNAESLFEKGLQGGGYANFLSAEAERGFSAAKQKYAQDTAALREKNLSGYARYLSSREEQQKTLQKQMIDRIGRGESFDTESAYEIALTAGLTQENARAAAELGVRAAKQRATSRLLEMILDKRLKESRVKEYARKMGFSEEEVEKFGAYAKEINSTKIPSTPSLDIFD